MIWLGLKNQTHGYGCHVRAFHRDGTPLPAKMVGPLAEEAERAQAELDAIKAAIAGSLTTKARRKSKEGTDHAGDHRQEPNKNPEPGRPAGA